MNGRFVLGVYATPATGNLRPTLGEYHRRFPDEAAQTVHCGQDTFQTDLADSAIDVVIMMTILVIRPPSSHLLSLLSRGSATRTCASADRRECYTAV
jgi:DNA-binding transcriptional LysR family regulator